MKENTRGTAVLELEMLSTKCDALEISEMRNDVCYYALRLTNAT